ncbi:hypothetical protein E2C01_031767 [Portunus trituberculatus]|uniref:Uncharacterized protein n=1 Tax=Portunus trituberculatus TaxID=210409 RepID=A0A5B7ETN4_PORTR|nr:hypothetical protein [Portunus trituberculatus]
MSPMLICLVSANHDFYRLYVSRAHLQRRPAAHSWCPDARLHDARDEAERLGLLFQTDPSPELLRRCQRSKDDLTALLECVLERILFTRLMYRLQDRHSPRLFGFLPQRSTHHCLVDLYSRISRDAVVAFIDLKSDFDVASRDIILDQLVDFGIRGNLLRWIRDYLSNRSSRVFFSGASATCGLIVSPHKSRIFSCRPPAILPDFTVGGTVIPLCSQYRYLGAPMVPLVVLSSHLICRRLLGRWVGRRLRDRSSTTLCELNAILDADSLLHNDAVDRLAKEACRLPHRGDGRPLSLPCYLSRVLSAAFLPEQRRRDIKRPYSVTINQSVYRSKFTCRRRGLMVRRHNVVSAHLRLSYRSPWQVAGLGGSPPSPTVAYATPLVPTPSSTTVWRALLCDTSCPRICHYMPSAASTSRYFPGAMSDNFRLEGMNRKLYVGKISVAN